MAINSSCQSGCAVVVFYTYLVLIVECFRDAECFACILVSENEFLRLNIQPEKLSILTEV